jgi:hypothetical protein
LIRRQVRVEILDQACLRPQDSSLAYGAFFREFAGID